MAESTNQRIRDDLTTQDLTDRRLIAGMEAEVDKRLVQLERDLKALIFQVDPAGARQRRSKKRRTKQINTRSRELITEAYRDINNMTRKNLTRLSRVESRSTALTIESDIHG